MAADQAESDLYPIVARWLVKHLGCFSAEENIGTRNGRIDVVGLRDVGGDLSGRAELVGVEVKKGSWPFMNAAGQAKGYSVAADYCYLAMQRAERPWFTQEERLIAARLGVGLLAIGAGNRIHEVATAPLNEPLDGQRLRVIDKMGYAVCTICSTAFRKGSDGNKLDHVVRGDLKSGTPVTRAVKQGKGLIYWLEEAAERDPRVRQSTYWRRFVCPDCIWSMFQEFAED